METLAAAERELASQVAFLTRAVDAHGEQQRLRFNVEEEQAIEDRLNAAANNHRKAIQETEEWLLEVTDPQALASGKQGVAASQACLKTNLVGVRKVLLSYREKAKVERLKQARDSLLQKSSDGSSGQNASLATRTGSGVDVIAALKRTQRGMKQEIDRVVSINEVLHDGRASLTSSHKEFGTVNAELDVVHKQIKALEWQARQDRMWIAAGIALLASTVLYIVHQRTGLIII